MTKHKRLFITGGTSGVGKELALQAKERGFDVITTGRNEKRLQELERFGIQTIQADLTHEQDRKLLVSQLESIDVVIVNAGLGVFEYAHLISDVDIDEMLRLNVEVPIKLTRDLLPKMKAKGQFIFIGSQAGKVATPKASVYAATKHALIGYTNALRMELKERYTITVVHPGPIDTPFLDHADQTNEYRQAMKHVLLTPKDVAKKTLQTIGTRKREINIPWYMGISSKLYAMSPSFIEKVGQSFFNKK